MMKNFLLRAVFWHVAVNWFLVIEIESQSYTKTYDGYVFTLLNLSAYRTKDEAQMLCAQNGSKLLEIKSSYVQTLTVRFLADTGVQFTQRTVLFTNGVRNDGSWNRVNGQGIDSITVSDQQSLDHSFGYIDFDVSASRLYIAAGAATSVRGYMCEVAGKVYCTNGLSKNGVCFQTYVSSKTSWFDTRNLCLNDGGDLATFEFINDDQELNSTLYGSWLSSSTTYWIGIRRQLLWQWQNIEARYTNWDNGYPVYALGSRCLCLSKFYADWTWRECDCKSAFPFVCLTEPTTTTTALTQVFTRTSTTRTTTLSESITDPLVYPNTSTMEPTPLSKAMAIGNTDSRALAVGLGIGIPLVLVILALIVVIVTMRKKLSYQTRLLANTPGVTDTVTHAQSPVKRNPQTGVSGSAEMVSEQNTSPYESLKHEETTIIDGNYQELRIPAGRGTNNPQTLDYEPLRIG